MSRNQSWLIVVIAIVAAILFLALVVYYGVAAVDHPRLKHMLLFVVLAVVSVLFAWFSLPKQTA